MDPRCLIALVKLSSFVLLVLLSNMIDSRQIPAIPSQ